MMKNYMTKQNTRVRAWNLGIRSSMLLTAFLMCLSLKNAAFSHIKKEQPWVEKGLKQEIESKRTRTSKHFLNDNNSISTFISPASIHYMDADHTWKEISTDIVANTAASHNTHPYASVYNAIQTYFPTDPFNDYLLMSSREGTFREKISAIRFLDASGNTLSTLALTANVSAKVQGNRIIYSGFHPDLSLSYTLGSDSRKFDLIIHSANFLKAIPAGAASVVIDEEFISGNQDARIQKLENEIRLNINGTHVLGFAQPLAFDNNVMEDQLAEGQISVKENAGKFSISSAFAVSWISNSARSFPVHLDPTVNYYPQNVTYWTGNQSSSSGKSSGMLRITTASTASWAKFDLTSLPGGASVTQATYYGYHYSTTSTTKICEIRGLGTLDPVPAAASALFTQSYNGTLYNNNYTYGGSTYGWNPGALNSAGMADVAAAAGSWIGLGFGYASGSTTFMYHYGINGSASQMCYLEVVYFTVPCSSVPSANSVVAPTVGICPGTSANLSLASTYSVGGITYQWQSSTTSSVGPFTSVPGATNSAMTTPTLNTSTWYTVIMTCTSVSGSVTATAGNVMIQGTTINSIPYFESFEGITSENDLPNCSWSASNLGFTALTYTSSNTLGRIPKTGTNFASFYYSPAGTNYFYSNGLQLNAGVTYSASLWFQTEYYGYNNWSDMSILVGPNQSTTGLAQVASTNGPAVSNIYKLLSGTFSVPSSGVYYIAVRGTTGSGSAQYLSWDDLSVVVPCSLNSPTISVSAGSATVCEGDAVSLVAAGADTYTWSTGSVSDNINESPLMSTVYSVAGTNILTGCSSMASQTVIVNPAPLVLIYASSPSVCAGSSLGLTAMGADSYLWSSGAGGPYATVFPAASGAYSVIGTNAFGCSNVASQQITVKPLPTVLVSSSLPNEMCAGETVTLAASGASSYVWISSTSPFIFGGSSISDAPSGTTVYTVTGTDSQGCSNKATFLQNLSECTSLKEMQGLHGLRIYPNPVSDELTLELNTWSQTTVELTDLSGRIILQSKVSDEKTKINMASFADGIYYVRVISQGQTEVLKVIKK